MTSTPPTGEVEEENTELEELEMQLGEKRMPWWAERAIVPVPLLG